MMMLKRYKKNNFHVTSANTKMPRVRMSNSDPKIIAKKQSEK